MTVSVERLTAEDWATWREVRLRSLADAPDAFGSTLAREQPRTEPDWRRWFSGPVVLVREDGAAVACGAAFAQDPGMYHVVAMWTAPEARGRGHALTVLGALAAAADEAGRRLVLDVTVGNDAARRLYERFGFVGTGSTEPLREGSSLLVERMVLPGG